MRIQMILYLINLFHSTVLYYSTSRNCDCVAGTGYNLQNQRIIIKFQARARDSSLFQSVQTGIGAHTAFYSFGTWGPFPEAHRRSLISVQCRGQECLDLELHYVVCLQGVHRDDFTFPFHVILIPIILPYLCISPPPTFSPISALSIIVYSQCQCILLAFLPCIRTTFSCFPSTSTLKTATADSIETLVRVYQANSMTSQKI